MPSTNHCCCYVTLAINVCEREKEREPHAFNHESQTLHTPYLVKFHYFANNNSQAGGGGGSIINQMRGATQAQ
jgi:hypothetical protein